MADAVLKDIMPEMEHPFYSLSKKPDTTIRRYEHNGNWLEFSVPVNCRRLCSLSFDVFVITRLRSGPRGAPRQAVGRPCRHRSRCLERRRSRASARRSCGSRCRSEGCTLAAPAGAAKFQDRVRVAAADVMRTVADTDLVVLDDDGEDCFGLQCVRHDVPPFRLK